MHSEQELWRYLDGELPAEETKAIETSAATDDVLRARLDEMRALKKEVLAGAPTPPAGFAARVALLAQRMPNTPLLDMEDARRFLKRTLVAAAVLGAVGLAYLAFGWLPDILEPPPIQANPLLGGK